MIVLKILLFIILAVLGIIILVLCMPVSVKFSFIDGKIVYKAKFFLLNVIDSDGGGIVGKLMKKAKKPRPSKNKKNSSDTNTNSDNMKESVQTSEEHDGTLNYEEKSDAKIESTNTFSENEDEIIETDDSEKNKETSLKKEKKSLGDIFELISGIWQSAKRPVRKIFKGFHFSDIYIYFIVADEDAYKCAINYGRICTAVYNGLSVMGRIFTTKIKTVDIECGFAQEKSKWDVSLNLWFVPMTAVIAGVWFLITYIFRVFLPKKIKKRKSAKKQKTQPQGGM